MVRFMFICMGVVALSIIAMSAQFMIDGVTGETVNVAARNVEPETVAAVPATAETTDLAVQEEPSAEDLNAIATTAGGPEDSFKGGFTNEAPKSLREPAVVAETPATTPEAQAPASN